MEFSQYQLLCLVGGAINWTPAVMHQTIVRDRRGVILSGAPPAPIVPEETLIQKEFFS